MTRQQYFKQIGQSSQESLFDRGTLYDLSHTKEGENNAFNQLSINMQRRLKLDNMHLLPNNKFTDKYNLPIVEPHTDPLDFEFVAFSKRKKYLEKKTAIHFFGNDEVIISPTWNKIDKTTAILRNYPLATGPDYSVFVDAPFPINLNNVYRSRLITAYWQKCGIPTVPLFSFGNVESMTYCLDGLPSNSNIALTGIGHESSRSSEKLWNYCVERMIEEKAPLTLIIYGGTEEKYSHLGVPIRYIPDHINLKLRKI